MTSASKGWGKYTESLNVLDFFGCTIRKRVFGHNDADCEGPDQGILCPLTESLDTTECMNEEQRPGWYFEHAQDDMNLHILCMFECIF